MCGRENATAKLSDAGISDCVLKKLVDTRTSDVSSGARSHRAAKSRVKRAASRPRLVANSKTSSDWLARDARIWASYAANIIVLGSRRDDEAQPLLPDASHGANGSESTALPSCRGPPQVVARRPLVAGTTSVRRSV